LRGFFAGQDLLSNQSAEPHVADRHPARLPDGQRGGFVGLWIQERRGNRMQG
jgi:hypothetical protein